jgi:cysteine synthase
LVVKVLQTDATATKSIKATGGQPYVVPAAGILGMATALRGAPIGSRAVAVVPSTKQTHGQILVIDVISQL